MLRHRQRIVVADPRRMGKTFWARVFSQELDVSRRRAVVFIDYQGVESVEEFLTRTVRGLAAKANLPAKFMARLGAWFDNAGMEIGLSPLKLKAAVHSPSKTHAEILEEVLTRLDADVATGKHTPVLIVMDELSDAVLAIAGKAPTDALNLLQRLRHLRNTTGHIDWIVCGSVGFHHVLNAAGATEAVLNDLQVLKFGPLTPPEATELAQCLALGIGRQISQEAVRAVIEASGGIPSLIQKLFDMMRFTSDGRPAAGPIEPAEVLRRLDEFIDDRDLSKDVTHYVTRIEVYYGALAKLAFKILDAAVADNSVTFADLERAMRTWAGDAFDRDEFVAALNLLKDDHYLSQDGPAITWKYPLIRRIYQHRRNLF
ncbi:MAG: hypothetical protein LBH76_08115 [Propionibacteriaceae bacterium]|jgi:hypothetical protein|nr:hypothetical protein [Propionibacteriaceae bacterium]